VTAGISEAISLVSLPEGLAAPALADEETLLLLAIAAVAAGAFVLLGALEFGKKICQVVGPHVVLHGLT
jgi:hypothetical protein